MKYVATGLLLLAYLLAVVDGMVEDTALYPSGGGRRGVRRYCREHPFVVAGAVCGLAGTLVGTL